MSLVRWLAPCLELEPGARMREVGWHVVVTHTTQGKGCLFNQFASSFQSFAWPVPSSAIKSVRRRHRHEFFFVSCRASTGTPVVPLVGGR